MTKVAIIILHFGDKNDTFECLNSLSKTQKNKIDLQIFLVDNDPKNRISNNELSYPLSIRHITTKKNLGFGGGVNLGLQEALKGNYGYILLLNNDIVVKRELFDKLLPFFKLENAGIVSPVITYYDHPEKIWCCDGHLNKIFLFARYPHMNKNIRKVSFPQYIESDFGAACLLIKTDVFKKIGFFDERYFLNVEDIEWCFRAKQAGVKIIYAPYPLALHKVSTNTGIRGTNRLTPSNAYYYARNMFIFLRDHITSCNLFTALIGQTFIRLPFYILFRANSFAARQAYIRGYFVGLYYLITGNLLR